MNRILLDLEKKRAYDMAYADDVASSMWRSQILKETFLF